MTRYVRSGDLDIAYQVVGEGPLDVVFIPIFASNLEIMWEHPGVARFLSRVASFARLIMFDRRGTGMSDGIPGAAALEEQIDDVLAVLDVVGARAAGARLDARGQRARGAVRGLTSGEGAGAGDDDAAAADGAGTGLRMGADGRAARRSDGAGHRALGHRLAGEPVGRQRRRPTWSARGRWRGSSARR